MKVSLCSGVMRKSDRLPLVKSNINFIDSTRRDFKSDPDAGLRGMSRYLQGAELQMKR